MRWAGQGGRAYRGAGIDQPAQCVIGEGAGLAVVGAGAGQFADVKAGGVVGPGGGEVGFEAAGYGGKFSIRMLYYET